MSNRSLDHDTLLRRALNPAQTRDVWLARAHVAACVACTARALMLRTAALDVLGLQATGQPVSPLEMSAITPASVDVAPSVTMKRDRWRPLARIVSYRAKPKRIQAYLANITGTIVGWTSLDPLSVIKLERVTGLSATPSGLRGPLDPSMIDEQGREPGGKDEVTLAIDGWHVRLALSGDDAEPTITLHLLVTPTTGWMRVRSGNDEVVLAGVGASGDLPLRAGDLEIDVPIPHTVADVAAQ